MQGTHIPEEEILMEILGRLPLKSLFRFKCVSESWKTLMYDPYFKRKHLNHAKNNPNSQKLLFGASSPGKLNKLNFYCSSLSPNRLVNDLRRLVWPSISKPYSGYKVYCCCDALFLIGIWIGPNLEEPSMLLLWNPSTSESIVLPHLGSPKQVSTYGLGYDSTSDDYKVLRIDQEGKARDEILALKHGSWRKIDQPSIRVEGDGSSLSGRECLSFLHGAFHWLGFDYPLNKSMASLNISDETYRMIPLPGKVHLYPETTEVGVIVELGISVLGGMLCVFNNDQTTFNLWTMREYGVKKSWTKLLTIPSNGACLILPIYRFSDGEVLLRYDDYGAEIIYRIYDGLTNRIWSLLDCDDIDPATIFQGFVYTESLISPRLDH